MSVKIIKPYKGWKPVIHKVIKNRALAETIHERGYEVIPFLSPGQLDEIRSFYKQEHSLDVKNGGMFYSLYSNDLAYRKRIHETLGDSFKPLLNELFTDYRNIINTFITKASGPQSEFYIHQDSTAVDEFKYSPLSIWIPLQDITPENGALAVVEKSHWFFSPYRGISFSSPFKAISEVLRPYLKPIYLKAGEALIFDSRIVHNSMPNVSGSDRLVALCGIFPKEAEFLTCFKGTSPGSKIEVIGQDDQYILENKNFFYNCHSRPETGVVLGQVEDDFPEMKAETFERLCELNNIVKTDALRTLNPEPCNMIAEPDGVNLHDSCEMDKPLSGSVWQRIKSAIS